MIRAGDNEIFDGAKTSLSDKECAGRGLDKLQAPPKFSFVEREANGKW